MRWMQPREEVLPWVIITLHRASASILPDAISTCNFNCTARGWGGGRFGGRFFLFFPPRGQHHHHNHHDLWVKLLGAVGWSLEGMFPEL